MDFLFVYFENAPVRWENTAWKVFWYHECEAMRCEKTIRVTTVLRQAPTCGENIYYGCPAGYVLEVPRSMVSLYLGIRGPTNDTH